jgi:hypothetical protein
MSKPNPNPELPFCTNVNSIFCFYANVVQMIQPYCAHHINMTIGNKSGTFSHVCALLCFVLIINETEQ